MDLLASLNLDVLPEQQTRTSSSHVRSTLESNPDAKLGFNACCNCGSSDTSVSCRGCKRVVYCSNKCRAEDADPPLPDEPDAGDVEGLPEAMGHSSVICALLRLCNDDEDADDRRSGSSKRPSQKGKLGGLTSDEANADDRVRSELESYPATLANIITDGPCYQQVLSSCRSSKKKELVVHVIGASLEAELWYDTCEAADAYAEALSELATMHRMDGIKIIFVGPECPKGKAGNAKEERDMGNGMDDNNDSQKGQKRRSAPRLIMETSQQNYDHSFQKEGLGSLLPADIVVFFNPGFTCPDYDWESALSHIKPGTPFLVTTNTEMEGISDVQYLHEKGWMHDIPPGIADIIEGENDDSTKKMTEKMAEDEGDDGEDGNSFFSENPYAGSRVRQSGTMANDLFVKNRWIFGGFFGEKSSAKKTTTKRKNVSVLSNQGGESKCDEETNENQFSPPPKKHKVKGKGNSKKSNPALI